MRLTWNISLFHLCTKEGRKENKVLLRIDNNNNNNNNSSSNSTNHELCLDSSKRKRNWICNETLLGIEAKLYGKVFQKM